MNLQELLGILKKHTGLHTMAGSPIIVSPLGKKVVKIDVVDANELNKGDNKKGSNMLEEVGTALEAVLAEAEKMKGVVEAAVSAPNVHKIIVEALVAALEAQGYTVTPPAV